MSFSPRAACALLLVAVFGLVQAQQAPLATDRDKVGYMIGMDVARSLEPAMPDMDMAAFQKALENGMAGKQPLLDGAEAQKTSQSLMASIGARKSGKPAAALDRQKVGYLLGADVGGNLAAVSAEFDVPTMLRGLKDATTPNAKTLLSDEEASAVRSAFSAHRQAIQQTKAAEAGQVNRKAGQEFMAKNKAVKGVFTTPSGLQYMVLRQGNGPRPKPGERVHVNYVGTSLDGTKFDSSYDRGEPAVFGLNQVIPGWSEGVGMMPVGAKYRFWVPGDLAYGEKGGGDGVIGPNATLIFDVELLGVE
ncbi:FKBP-type peptidyl-prolyl cis-trans isomerase [Thermomonas sp.]|uniref:FKBP-type peptidyl-prolyl cis-trans isomerase n=1 Tax=Thermomonas sp. TaxID=1971895 RepID=UPI002488A460|nr:FKBP-type peptidyl-prolyl cis-trans isomerase [Thermomonas sp.]MDI1253259.1 FKBP-type peptidyl-prolyl cis-trans isomerase [Thermomonas sp.]